MPTSAARETEKRSKIPKLASRRGEGIYQEPHEGGWLLRQYVRTVTGKTL